MTFLPRHLAVVAVVLAAPLLPRPAQAPLAKPQPPKDVRLYVFDCGVISVTPVSSV
jgi:hypothetical protein